MGCWPGTDDGGPLSPCLSALWVIVLPLEAESKELSIDFLLNGIDEVEETVESVVGFAMDEDGFLAKEGRGPFDGHGVS